MRKRPIKSEIWQKPNYKWGLVITLSLIISLGIIIKLNNNNRKIVLEDFLLQEPGDWNGYLKLEDSLKRFNQIWTEKKPNYPKKLAEKDYIRENFEGQIREIQKISSDEEKLKLTELNNNFAAYSQKMKRQFELEFEKRAASINQSLEADLKQKKLAKEEQIYDIRQELEGEHHYNLVNLQLQLTLLDLSTSKEGVQSQKDSLLMDIARIKRDIDIKVSAEKKNLLDQFIKYEKQQRKEVKDQLEELKNELERKRMANLAEYRNKLEINYHKWQENKKQNFERAILIRQKQKK